MKLTRRRKVSLAVLGLALAALAADRLVFGPGDSGPSPASAATAAARAPGPAAKGKGPAPSVADRLDAARVPDAGSADAFALPPDWLPAGAAREMAARASSKEVLPRVTAVFPRTLQGGAEATINKQRGVHEGDVVDGWRVVKILGAQRGELPGVRFAQGERAVDVPLDSSMSKRPPDAAAPATKSSGEQTPDNP